MPANLSPEFKAAEDEYRQARDPQARLACLEKMLSAIPKHKGTEKMQADIKRRISKLKDGLERKSGKKGFSYMVDREGAAQIAIVGGPNVGKSSLVEATTNARVEIGDYPFTTRSPQPAMLAYENLQFQLVDMPAVSREHMEFWVTDIIRVADLALWVIDSAAADLERDVAEVCDVLADRKVEMVGHDALDDGMNAAVRKLRSLIVAAKMDAPGAARGLPWLKARFEPEFFVLPLSAFSDDARGDLGRAVFQLARIIRVYSKTPSKEPDLQKPYIMHQGDTLMDFARKVHKDFADGLRFARVWGEGKFDGQRIQRDQQLADGDVIELHI
ncbi:MAG: 50S ribosome-binding GTPase [Deltaproteobacteria bacterium]|nr:50S ribosome-binding GTPase [Deltaproteobacteria bacterium]